MEGILDCGICYETFQAEGERMPRILPCQHTFCSLCLKKLWKKNKKRILCPSCRDRQRVEVETLPKNFTLLSVLDVVNQQAEDKGEEHKPIDRCQTCRKTMQQCDVFSCSGCGILEVKKDIKEIEKCIREMENEIKQIVSTNQINQELQHMVRSLASAIRAQIKRNSQHSILVLYMIDEFVLSCTVEHAVQVCVKERLIEKAKIFSKKANEKIDVIQMQLRHSSVSCEMKNCVELMKNNCQYLNLELRSIKEGGNEEGVREFANISHFSQQLQLNDGRSDISAVYGYLCRTLPLLIIIAKLLLVVILIWYFLCWGFINSECEVRDLQRIFITILVTVLAELAKQYTIMKVGCPLEEYTSKKDLQKELKRVYWKYNSTLNIYEFMTIYPLLKGIFPNWF